MILLETDGNVDPGSCVVLAMNVEHLTRWGKDWGQADHTVSFFSSLLTPFSTTKIKPFHWVETGYNNSREPPYPSDIIPGLSYNKTGLLDI